MYSVNGGDSAATSHGVFHTERPNECELVEAGIWRMGAKPADGFSPPFDDHLVEGRCRRCICIMVTSSTKSVVKVPSYLVRQIMGSVVH